MKSKYQGKSIQAIYYQGWMKRGRSVRVVLDYNGQLKPIHWFRVDADGNIYFGQGNTNPKKSGDEQSKKAIEVGSLSGAEMVSMAIEHQSIISTLSNDSAKKEYLLDDNIVTAPIGKLEQIKQVCICAYQHPDTYSDIPSEQKRKRDIILKMPPNEHAPLWGHVFVTPVDMSSILTIDAASVQANVLFKYKGAKKSPGFMIQLVLCCGPKLPWPKYTSVLV